MNVAFKLPLEQDQTTDIDFVKYPCPGPVCPPGIQRTRSEVENICRPCLKRRSAAFLSDISALVQKPPASMENVVSDGSSYLRLQATANH